MTTTAADDLELGSFSDNPPWSIAQRPPGWLSKVEILRNEQQRDLPRLTTPPRIPPLRRLVRVVRVLGGAVGVWYLIAKRRQNSGADLARRLREAAEVLGPAYIKLAQIISAGEGLFPAELVAEAKKCRDQVPPVPYSEVVATVESAFGAPLHEIFSRFDAAPLAAASIAQVHAAKLATGEEVVVKVQRPGIGSLVKRDLQVLAWLAPFMIGRIPIASLANPPALVELFAETITEELDFRVEAANMLDIAEVFVKLDQRNFVVPRPHPKLVGKRALVMERLDGFKFDDVSGMKEGGVDTHKVIRTGMIGFLEGTFLHGIFHGDLHGGNLFVMPDGRTALVDFGITGRLSEKQRMAFLRMMMSATTNDVQGQVEALRDLGALPADTDIDTVIADLGLDGTPIDPTTLEPEQLVAEMQRVVKALLGYGARIPKSLMLYIKNLIFLDGAIATLAPELDMFAIMTEIANHFAKNHGASISSQLGMKEEAWDVDLGAVKATLGANPDDNLSVSYRELQERRELIRRRLAGREIN